MNKQSGITLIEVMVALVVGLLVVGAVIAVYNTSARSGSDTLKLTQVNHELESVMAMMTNDIRRAGYWRNAVVNADSRSNPFNADTTRLQILATGTCVLYSYDADGDGSVDNDEYYGFRLSGETIQMRKTGSTTANCTDDGTWEEFIDGSRVDITNLQFSLTPVTGLAATSRCLNVTTGTATNGSTCTGAVTGNNVGEKRVVNIRLEGEASSDASIRKVLNDSVVVKNHCLRQIP